MATGALQALDAKSLLAELRALRRKPREELVLLGADLSPGLERGPVGEGLPERAVRSQEVWGGTAHSMPDGRTLIVPDLRYDASRDKPDAPVLDVWGEPLVLARPEKPAWPSKQRVGLFLPE